MLCGVFATVEYVIEDEHSRTGKFQALFCHDGLLIVDLLR